ncbi:MAG: flagellar hook protein FlgE [Burkholderiaceae bacterium]|nr:flagellar hook protein FlgE [Burkholderiaceae bacterium]
MAFQQGLSGLNAASKNLDVIGHNIANSGTTGFKASRTEFADIVATSMGASGGLNTGFGVEVAAVAQQFSQGSLTITGNNLDLAINGNGFFQIQQPNGSLAYTRAGDFKLDKVGNMLTNGGGQVMGYKVDQASGLSSSTTTPLSFPSGAPIAAQKTTSITAALNLDARAQDAVGVAAVAADPAAVPPVAAKAAIPATPASTYGTSINVYDSQGVATPVNLYFLKNGANTWEVYTDLAAAETDLKTAATAGPGTALAPTASLGQLKFNENGAYDPTSTFTTLNVTPAANPNQGAPAPLVEPFDVTVDLSQVTQFGNKFAISDLKQDGYASGTLTGINISDSGMVMASYSNGMTRAEAQVALATFRNPQGLTQVGGNNWVESADSGPFVMGKPGDGQFGGLRSGALEDSNVDLTAELVNMMTAQRAYQANAQTIKTQDQVLSTLVNLR